MTNNKQKIYWLKGLPGSGKSFWAKEKVAKSDGRIKRVNKDDLRDMIDCGKWSKEREKSIIKSQLLLIESFLSDGYSVICDNTNFNPRHLDDVKLIVNKIDPTIEIEEKFFDIPLYECIRRDAKRGDRSVGEKVIYRMYSQNCQKENPSNPSGKPAVIFDIDGTLAEMHNRSPYEWDKVLNDFVNISAYELYRGMKQLGYNIIIFSGRDSVCKADTEKWLSLHNISYDYLDMRPEGNNEKDAIVKGRMFEKIKDKYNILMVIDDRAEMIDYWRSIGLTAMQCNYGLF